MNETWDTDDLLQNYVEPSNDHSGELYHDTLNAFPAWDWRVRSHGRRPAPTCCGGWERFVDVKTSTQPRYLSNFNRCMRTVCLREGKCRATV